MTRRVCHACDDDGGLWDDNELIEVPLDDWDKPVILCPLHRGSWWVDLVLSNRRAAERLAAVKVAREAAEAAIPTWKRRFRTGVEVFVAVCFFVGLLSVVGFTVWAAFTAPPEPTPEESIAAAQAKRQAAADARRRAAEQEVGFSEWIWIGQSCADGWSSDSIGEQGACSWHGGVVSIYENDAGGRMECAEGWPPSPEKALEQLDKYGVMFCSSDIF